MGRGRRTLALACVIAAAAGVGLLLWATPPTDHAQLTAAKGPTGPAYPSLLQHALAGVTSIEIRRAGELTTIVRRPATVRRIVNWFDELPHPQHRRFVHSDPCSGYRPWVARFDFHGADGGVLLHAVDRLPGAFAGACPGSISFKGRTLSDDGFLTRVSDHIGVDLSANPRTLQHEEAAKRDAAMLLGRMRVPPGSQLLKTIRPSIAIAPDNSVSGSRTWRVQLPLLEVYRWEKAHTPRGSGPGDFSAAAGWDANHGRPIADRGEGYGYPSLAGVPYRELDLEVSRFVPHGLWTQIRADVSETWIVARPSYERVPRGVRTIVIHGLGRGVRPVTRPDVVARIVSWFDSRRVVQSFGGECGLMSGSPSVRIAFLGADNAVLASATDPRRSSYGGGCNPISFSVGGRREPELDPGIKDSFERLLR